MPRGVARRRDARQGRSPRHACMDIQWRSNPRRAAHDDFIAR